MDQRGLTEKGKTRREASRRVSSERGRRGALLRAGLTALLMGISAVWAADLEVIQAGVTSPRLIDVRTEKEFGAGALNGALNHPLQGLPDSLLKSGIALDDEVIVYCRSGRRSAKAKARLKAAGFQRVFDGGAMKNLEDALREPNS